MRMYLCWCCDGWAISCSIIVLDVYGVWYMVYLQVQLSQYKSLNQPINLWWIEHTSQ